MVEMSGLSGIPIRMLGEFVDSRATRFYEGLTKNIVGILVNQSAEPRMTMRINKIGGM